MEIFTGYIHASYAASLAEFGAPRRLANCDGWVLERRVPGLDDADAMGCYPLFACRDWGGLAADISFLEEKLVSLSLVTDPFGDYAPKDLTRCFGDIARPFKEHFVTDLAQSREAFVHSHHKRYARLASRTIGVEVCPDPALYSEEWAELYRHLILRHGIKGISAFSAESFVLLFHVPGVVLLRAVRDGVVLGMTVWLRQGNVAYYHLGAYSEEGYRQRASYALFWNAIEYFAGMGMGWLCLGGGAGAGGDAGDGLSRFKAGWATGTRTAYFCGRILDPRRYDWICRLRGVAETGYFPSYRQGEFR